MTAAPAASPLVVQSQDAPVRDHQLFVGVDLVLNHEAKMVNVRKIEDKKALLDTPDRQVIALRNSGGLQWKMATKVSATSATIDGLKSDRVHSPYKNSVLKQMRDNQAIQDFVQDQIEKRDASVRESMRPAGSPSADAMAQEEIDASVAATMAEIGDFQNLGNVSDRATNSANPDGVVSPFDAVRLSFMISSPTPIADAYVVAILRVTVEGAIHDTSFYRQIGPVDANPRKVKFMQAGMPEGFEIQDVRVHLYWQGEEIPSNLSEKHYAVTAEEAKTYVQLDHLGRHRGQSVPASPVWSIVPPALLAAESASAYDLPVTVELDAEGQLVGIRSANMIVPANIRAIVEQMTFVPALEKGKGVPSTLTVNPAGFFKEI